MAKKFPIVLVLDQLTSPANIGSIFRLADAFGVSKIILHNCDFQSTSSRFRRTARHTDQIVSFETSQDSEAIIAKLHSENFKIVALEITSASSPIEDLILKPLDKLAIIIGSERRGISQYFLENSAKHTHITMFGKNSSMNVAQATSIALFQITKTLTISNEN